ncbi:MAG: HDOD domain-containing protein [Oscillospiraceae bacterium]|jgi:EAL and modified HD-GYP domain-containing signal transduction protein|nr:HDOD domain-containing protein [Oscillospiraceae bacterium]MCI8757831.1 HDOD domain-containing protein [Oscillospiraceae bacterium]MCI9563045.1 HDOD domain-containing protein [Oscillospiraceae bacterium]
MANNSKYIVRQPIKDLQGKILGYEIRYAGEDKAYDGGERGNDFAAADMIYSFLTQNAGKALKDGVNFMTFTTNLLMKQAPRLFTPGDLVIQVDDSVIIHPLALRFVERYAQNGYKVAVNEFQFSPRYISLLDKFDYIKINFKTTSDSAIRSIVEMAHGMGKKCVATCVDDEDLYQKTFVMEVDAMEGRYVAEQMFTAVHSSGYLQSNFFRLMVAITKDEPNVEEIEQIISMDATLTYSLLRIVNSAYFALRNRATDVHQAIVALGLSQLRQWIYLLGTADAQGELDASQEEMLKLSLTRATFASELMKYAKDMPISRNDAYLMGMFSTLTYLIAAPMEEILADIPVAQPVKDALINHEGRCGVLYDLVINYGRADWAAIGEQAKELGLPEDQLADIYFRCVEEVNRIWQQLMDTSGVN